MTEAKEVQKPLYARIAWVATRWFWYGSIALLVGYVVAGVMAAFSPSESKHIMVGFMAKPILLALISYQLRGLVRSAYGGRPFTFDNVRRLRLIGLCTLIYGPLNVLAKWIQLYSSHKGDFLDLSIRLGVDSADTIFLGLLILVLAQVFDMGVRLQTDNDLTV